MGNGNLQKIGETVASSLLTEGLPSEVAEWFEGDGKLPGAWIVMCSGGADSVALLLWLWGTFPARRKDLRVLHVHHGVRAGAESDADFVSELAWALDLRLRVVRREAGEGQASEAALRAFRQKAIDGACAREAVAAIFTGHQADDVAENLLFRLARGSGLRGLSGMRPLQIQLGYPPRLRPLLLCSRERIRETLRSAQARWVEDETNTALGFTRNRLRAGVVPAWQEAVQERSLLKGIRRSHRHLREAEVALEQWAARILNGCRDNALVLDILNGLPMAVRRRVLEAWWRRESASAGPLSDDTLEELLDWAEECAEDQFILGAHTLISDGTRWYLKATSDTTGALIGNRTWTLSPDTLLELPSGHALSLSLRILDEPLRQKIFGGAFSPQREVYLGRVKLPITIRGWRPGDRYHPLGAPGSKKLQDAFTDGGIPRERRHELPVVCDASGAIVWVPGLAPAELCRVGPETTRALWLTYGAV